MSSVEAPPFFSTVSSADLRPSCRTRLVCSLKPSRTEATSRIVMTLSPTTRIGRSPISSIFWGLLFSPMMYSRLPICVEPVGRLTFWRISASLMSFTVTPRACIFSGSASIMIRRGRPP